jgi:hypothetical protein
MAREGNDGKRSASYDELTVKKILELGAEVEKSRPMPTRGADAGRTVDEIVAIAKEAGITERSVRIAVDEFSDLELRRELPVLGGARLVEARERISGEPSKEQLEDLLALIPSLASCAGSGRIKGRTLSWNSSRFRGLSRGGLGIQLREYGDGYEVAVSKRLVATAAWLYASVMAGIALAAGMGVGIGLQGSAKDSVLLFSIALLPSYAIARTCYKSACAKAKVECAVIAKAVGYSLE